MPQLARRSASGHRLGQAHHRAKMPDVEVIRMRFLRESARHMGLVLGYERLAAMFRCGVSTARDICGYRTRPT